MDAPRNHAEDAELAIAHGTEVVKTLALGDRTADADAGFITAAPWAPPA